MHQVQVNIDNVIIDNIPYESGAVAVVDDAVFAAIPANDFTSGVLTDLGPVGGGGGFLADQPLLTVMGASFFSPLAVLDWGGADVAALQQVGWTSGTYDGNPFTPGDGTVVTDENDNQVVKIGTDYAFAAPSVEDPPLSVIIYTPGLYSVSASATFAANGTGFRGIVSVGPMVREEHPKTAAVTGVSTSGIAVNTGAGDFHGVLLQQSSGDTLDCTAVQFNIQRVL